MRGSLLGQASLAIRSQAVQRVCHCLTLSTWLVLYLLPKYSSGMHFAVGQNITGVRAAVLAVFQKLGVGLLLRPEIQRFGDLKHPPFTSSLNSSTLGSLGQRTGMRLLMRWLSQ